MEPQQLLEIQKKIDKIVLAAGKYALSRFGNVEVIQKGNEGDVVTEVDKKIEQDIREKLSGLVEGATILGEEEGGERGEGVFWVIDPIDGTKNFAHQMPGFFTQVALVMDNKPIIAVVYDPISDHLFSASKGNGVTLNRIHLQNNSSVSELSKAVIDIDFGGPEDNAWKSKVFSELAKQTYRIRLSGGRFTPYLMTGGINAVLVVNPTTKLWDQMPRILLIEEAGFDVREKSREDHLVRVMAEKTLADKIWEIVDSV